MLKIIQKILILNLKQINLNLHFLFDPEGVKSRGKVSLKWIMLHLHIRKILNLSHNITIKASMSSRVACVGVNGAGKQSH